MAFFFSKMDKEFDHIIGEAALKQSTIAHSRAEDSIVEFLVTPTKQPNYLEHCQSLVEAKDPVSTINKYTDHNTKYFAHVNLSLAADSPAITNCASYIQDLRASILSQPLLDEGPFYRGVDLSQREISEMESLQRFFIPSFTSTSIDRNKAYTKSAFLVIKAPLFCKYACSITSELSKFHSTEKEVLISCYSAFVLERTEKVNSTTILTLWLDEFASGLERLVYTA